MGAMYEANLILRHNNLLMNKEITQVNFLKTLASNISRSNLHAILLWKTPKEQNVINLSMQEGNQLFYI
jgi:hypothetical protein